MKIMNAILTLGVVALATPSLSAEWKYREVPKRQLDPKREALAHQFNKGASSDAEGIRALQETCTHYISRFTEPYDQKTPNFVAYRRSVDALLAEGAPKQPAEARRALVSTLVNTAGRIAESNEYSPAARINCAAILGDLDDARDSTKNLRKPSAAAREKLLQILAAPTTPGYLKSVILQGLERHARDSSSGGWDESVKAKVAQAASTYANAKPPHDADRELNTWLARRGLDLLRSLRSKDGVDAALGYLADPEEMPNLRLSALSYLRTQDLKSLSDPQKKLFVLGLVHFLRSQLVAWYSAENERRNRITGGPGGRTDGFGGGGGIGMGSDGGGRFGSGSGGSGDEPKPIESQTWETRTARRQLNQITQLVRYALEGKGIADGKVTSQNVLTAKDVGIGEEYQLHRLIQLIDELQSKINDRRRITTIQSLMNETVKEIKAIRDFSEQVPGFVEKYHGVHQETEELEEVAEEPAEETNDSNSEDDSTEETGEDS